MMIVRNSLCGLLAVCFAGAAQAQIVTGTTQSDRLDGKAPGPAPGAEPGLQRQPQIAGAPVLPSGVRISAVNVEGSSLSRSTIDAVTRKYRGSVLDADRLRALADDISKTYGQSRIALYSILVPQQTFSDGVVRIVAVENYVDEVVLAGVGASQASLTSSYAAAMAEERPITRPTLERYLLLMNDVPGATTTPKVLQGDRPDTVKLLLETTRKPIESVITLDTRGAERLGRTQLQGELYFNGFFYEGNQTKLTAAASSDFDKFVSLSASHNVTLGPSGVSLLASAGYFRTRPEDGSEGHGHAGGVQISYPLIRSTKANVYVAAGVDGVDTYDALVGQSLSSDHTRAMRLAASGEVKDGGTSMTASASYSRGVDNFGSEVANPAFANPNFAKANLQAGVTHAIGDDWRIQLAGKAQLSDDMLPVVEMFSLGGATFGRAFATGVASGDSGVAGSFEVTRALGPLGPVAGSEVYGFVDGGRLWLEARPGFLGADYDLGSAGAGVRVLVAKETSLGLEAARAVDVIREGVDHHDWRLTLSLGSVF